MSTAISVWSRVLTPGQDALVSEEVSIQITNVVLEFDESKKASDKRSTLKMQHLTANPALLRAAAAADYDSDSEIDSDEFGEFDEDDEDELEDDEDDDDDMAAADTSKMSKASKASASSASSKKGGAAKVNGDATLEEEDDDDEDDEDDSDDEFDEEFERQEAEVQICSFIPGKVEQFTTNLILPGEEDFVFKLTGDYKVHLFGHYIMQPIPGQFDNPPRGYDSDEDDYSSGEEDDYISDSELGRYDPETGLLLEDDDDEDDELEEDDSRFMEIEEAKASPKKAAKDLPAAAAKKESKPEAKAAPAAAAPASDDASADKSKLSKNQLKKLAKKEKSGEAAVPKAEAPASKKEEAKPAAATKPDTAATKAPGKKTTLPSGLVYEDNKVGTGSAAKAGNRVQMRYIGRLANGKIFDQNTKGAPFTFKLGKGEVIKGWDVGVAGMQVGGERRLVIPPSLAYGKQAISGIPPNSTLTFEVKLISIK